MWSNQGIKLYREKCWSHVLTAMNVGYIVGIADSGVKRKRNAPILLCPIMEPEETGKE
jgi:hypothetical protein